MNGLMKAVKMQDEILIRHENSIISNIISKILDSGEKLIAFLSITKNVSIKLTTRFYGKS